MPADLKTQSDLANVLDEQKQHLAVVLQKAPEDISIFRGEITVRLTCDQLFFALTRLKDSTGGEFTKLSDITAVDYPGRSERFELIYQLLSVKLNQRLRLVVPIAENAVAP